MYQLDPNAAKEADNIGSYLTESGKYIGTFTRAEKLISKNKGTHGIGFTFECSGQTTKFDLWTMDASNKHLSGFNALSAIMTCISRPALRELKHAPGQVQRWNWDTNQNDVVQTDVFPGLVGKSLGLVLRKTEYAKMRNGAYTGETGWRLELVAPFRADDEFTASEIIDRKTKPEKLASLIATLADRPLRNRPAQGSGNDSGPPAGHPAADGGGFDDGSDIPF